MKITDFFNTEYVDQASYDNLRKIASLVDGQKNAGRKILYTILEKNITSKMKVSQLDSKVAEFAEYLHGSMSGVIVGLAQDYVGTNNLPILQKKGNFGTRFKPAASAPRYIYTYGSDTFFKVLNKEDNAVLVRQQFEGNDIEPMFYVPILPILLINGSEGVSSGFAQKILPRDPEKMKKYISHKLAGTRLPRDTFTPFYKGFNGTITQGETPNQWLIKGSIERKGVNKVTITEIPIGYNLKGYLNVLDKLEEDKVIQSYKDKSMNDKFLFEVTIPSKSLKAWDDETVLDKLKLIKTVSENYTVINENNKIQVFDSPQEIFDAYINVKLQFLQKRKEHIIEKLNTEITFDHCKYLFIKMIVDDELIINKRKKVDIVKDLEKNDSILKKDDSYDYLLNMNIISLTEERMKKLQSDIKEKQEKLKNLANTSIESLWLEEI